MDFSKTAQELGSAIGVTDLIEAASELKLEDVLGVLGLERRPSAVGRVLPALGLVAVSAAVGAGIALLLAPTSGTRLRAKLSDGIDDAKHRLSDRISHLESATSTKPSRHAVS
ncbi:MAG: YtxH domain-containing protein [Pseudomonadota bacterium]